MSHGKVCCRACGDLIAQCRCIDRGHHVTTYGVCEKCKGRDIVSLALRERMRDAEIAGGRRLIDSVIAGRMMAEKAWIDLHAELQRARAREDKLEVALARYRALFPGNRLVTDGPGYPHVVTVAVPVGQL